MGVPVETGKTDATKRALDEHEFRLALRALQEAAYGETG